jgi:hypothetical protein
VQHELAARSAGIGGDDRDFDAELVRRAGLAFADAFDLGGMEGIKLPTALTLLLGADLVRAVSCFFSRIVPSDAATESRLAIRGNPKKRNCKVRAPQAPETLQSQIRR